MSSHHPPAKQPAVPASKPGSDGNPTRWRPSARIWLVFAVVAVALVVAGVFRRHLTAKAETLVLERLADCGLHLRYQSRGWLPWRGLTFRDVALAREPDAAVPTIALSNLSAELSWGEIWNNRALEGEVTATENELKSKATAVVRGGRIEATLNRKVDEPLEFAGRARDARGGTSQFQGQWIPSDQTLRISQIEGDVDWLTLADALPIRKPVLPASVVVDRFPGMTLRDVVRDRRHSGAAAWNVASVRLTSPAAISVKVQGHPVSLRNLTGSAAFDGQRWRFRSVRTDVWGGTAEGGGVWSAGRLTDASIKASSLQMNHLTPWFGKAGSRLESGDLSLQYQGQLGTRSDQLTGRGSVRMTNAPLVEIPLLEPTYRLFSASRSSRPDRDQGGMTAGFVADRGVLRIDSFQAHSDAVTVTATGTIDLPRQRVDARARGELRGVAGWATQPLSRALEMKITGPLSRPEISAQGPVGIAGGLVRGTAESAVEAAQIPGKIIEGTLSFPQRLWRSLSGNNRSSQ